MQLKVNQVNFLGHRFSKADMEPDQKRVKAVLNLKSSQNKKDVQRILGMFNYFRNFIHNLSEISEPIRELLKKDIEFSWSSTQDKHLIS